MSSGPLAGRLSVAALLCCAVMGCGSDPPHRRSPEPVPIAQARPSAREDADPIAALGADLGETTLRDVDGDGEPEVVRTLTDRGSGFSTTHHCVSGGQQWSCRTERRTAYSLFSSWTRRTSSPAPREPLLHASPTCVDADRDQASQGAMWALAGASRDALEVTALPFEGKPVPQVVVCLDATAAASVAGAFSWEPSGAAENRAPSMWDIIVYDPGAGWFRDESERGRQTALRAVLTTKGYDVYVQRAAVAVYSAAKDRHAWIANYGNGDDDGFKVDRHTRIREVQPTSQGFTIVVAAPGARRIDVALP